MKEEFKTRNEERDLNDYPLVVIHRGNGVVLVRTRNVTTTENFMKLFADLITYLEDINPDFCPSSQAIVEDNDGRQHAIVTFNRK
ncbi:hypothetical protein IKN40_09700 [bacterium]|nr:hypothetical protein [bacterium]